MNHRKKISTLIIVLSAFLFSLSSAQTNSVTRTAIESNAGMQPLTLDQCINLALENNHQAKISNQALKIARTQYRQVMSAYWPRVSASANFIRLDESPHFVYPEETSSYVLSGLLA